MQNQLESLQNKDSKIKTACVDLRNWNETKQIIRSILPIDLLVNCAGVIYNRPFLDATEKDFDQTFAVNVKAMMNVSQVVAKDMIERKVSGSIVNLSSQASEAALQDHTVYCSSKGAVQMLTR